MKYRKLGKTGFEVSEISLGTWQVGGKWGSAFDEKNAEKIINDAIDRGINFIDTADVYSDGLSEAAVARVVKSRKEKVRIATKCGRRINPHISKNYTSEVLRKYVEDSLKNMKLDAIDLIQLHCPPAEVYYRPEIFGLFDDLKKEGKILNLGVSVEKVEEALKAITYPNVTSIQIIFNVFRQRPSELFFREAALKNIGIIVRVPLASGLLTGKFTKETVFEKDDHRFSNRNGEYFDKGETFSGIPYETGLAAVGELRKLFPGYDNLAPVALKWILMFKEVSCIIPGASRQDHIYSNLKAESEPEIYEDQLKKINEIYERYIRPFVYYQW